MARSSLDYNSIDALPDNFWNKVNKTDTCWLWTAKMDDGYGRFAIAGKMYLVHRLTMAVLKEKLDPNMVVDHICGTRNCCNPDHLRQVTVRKNTIGKKKQKDHTTCVNGHPLVGPDALVLISIRKSRHNGKVRSVTCKVCNSTKNVKYIEQKSQLADTITQCDNG